MKDIPIDVIRKGIEQMGKWIWAIEFYDEIPPDMYDIWQSVWDDDGRPWDINMHIVDDEDGTTYAAIALYKCVTKTNENGTFWETETQSWLRLGRFPMEPRLVIQ